MRRPSRKSVRLPTFLRILRDESDRAAAILGATYVESIVEDLLRSSLVDHPDVDAMFRGIGPFSSFSAKTAMLFAMGKINEASRSDLDLIRKIRNEFAHTLAESDFQQTKIAAWCVELTGAWAGEFAEPGQRARAQFFETVDLAREVLKQRTRNRRRKRTKVASSDRGR
jgi:DNA-binding MltR family transcriptional regulator